MRPDALRPGTAKAAAEAKTKLKTRLSKGEKSARKRMAEVAAVYDVTPVVRVPRDIIGRDDDYPRPPAPKAKNKWLNASVVDDAANVIGAAFDEACRRDPAHERTWIALVDGARHQIDRIKAEAKARDADVTVVCDFVHVMEYLWSSAWSFFGEGDPVAEAWVADRDRGDRRCRSTFGEGPARSDRLTMGAQRRRGNLEASGATQQRRPRELLEVPPRPGAPPGPRGTLRQRSDAESCLMARHSRGAAPISKARFWATAPTGLCHREKAKIRGARVACSRASRHRRWPACRCHGPSLAFWYVQLPGSEIRAARPIAPPAGWPFRLCHRVPGR